jgi:hypothetical protein
MESSSKKGAVGSSARGAAGQAGTPGKEEPKAHVRARDTAAHYSTHPQQSFSPVFLFKYRSNGIGKHRAHTHKKKSCLLLIKIT